MVYEFCILFQLFGNEDPMSFGIPMNPELDPHSNKGDKDEGETNGKEFFFI